MKYINITASSLTELYKKMLVYRCEGNLYANFKIDTQEIGEFDLNVKNNEIFQDYIKQFLNPESLIKHWFSSDNDWYLSYSRRLVSNNNNNLSERLINILKGDINSRRAIIPTFNQEDFIKDFSPALISVQFSIENNKLNMFTNWRSQEAIVALPFNILAMFSYRLYILNHLKQIYKNLEIGEYFHCTSSLHFKYNNSNFLHLNFSDVNIYDFEFLCSIIKKGGEDKYDENYRK